MFVCVLVACQKGIHWDLSSAGSLLKDSNGSCLPVVVAGNYVADSITGTDNFITVDVNVTTTGTYAIYTDSMNGYSFRAAGNFEQTGVQHVNLSCTGTPRAAETDHLTIHYDTSRCEADVIVKTNAIPSAVFSLQGAPGKCIDDSVAGNYTKGIVLDSSNRVNVRVNVSTPGRYNITTPVVNGYSFTGSGIFTTAGVQTVILFSNGTPIKEGTDVFSITAGSSTCSLETKVKGDAAEFTLQGAPGRCMDDTVRGTFVKGIPLEIESKVIVSVNVSAIGSYHVETNVVNGYSFFANGSFTTTGIQTIMLIPQGTPANGGIDIFTLNTGTSACSFEVNVLTDIVSGKSDDYFPLTKGSYWVYDDIFNKGNVIRRSIEDTTRLNGKLYTMLHQTDSWNLANESLYRRDNYDYFEYARNDKYTAAMQYAKSDLVEHYFLKQNVQQGDTWSSPEYSEPTTFNQVIALRYDYRCLKVNVVVTVGNKAFANVCIIEMRPFIQALQNPWSSTNEDYLWYYAKGIGLIYFKAISNFSFTKAEWQISSWQVN